MVLGGARADEEASRCLVVREAFGQQGEHLRLPLGKGPGGPRTIATGRPQAAEEAGGPVGLAPRREPLETLQGRPRLRDRNLWARGWQQVRRGRGPRGLRGA